MTIQRILILAVALLASACSTYRPWANTLAMVPSSAHVVAPAGDRSIVAALTLSGGGSRAAAFGLGVLRALKDTPIEWDGRKTTLLDEMSFVSGVSGGSMLAAHFAAFGDETLVSFERDFLAVDIESRLIRTALMPQTLNRLASPWYGRSQVLAEELDRLYRGRNFGDAAARPGAPELLITATDLRHGSAFEFGPEQLAAMCIDWRRIPLSFAVAASAAVPLMLSPVTLHNHAGQCVADERVEPEAAADFRTHLREATAATYRDAAARPFIHLVDGGLADNLGVRGLLDRFVAGGSITSGFRDAPPGSIRRLVLIVVNAERDVSESIELSSQVPSTGQVLDTLVFGAGARETQVTLAILQQDVLQWRAELALARGRHGSPFAADAEIHAVVVSLRDVPDPTRRGTLLRLPTSLTLEAEDVRALTVAGRDALRSSPAFQQLINSLRRSTAASAATVP